MEQKQQKSFLQEVNKMIDLNSSIIPWEGIGNIKLYSHISTFYDIIQYTRNEPLLLGKFLVKYEIDDLLDLWFNVVNGKLFKITALKNYTGKLLEQISIGMHIDDVLKIEPSFIYDDFEEVYVSNKGIYIETDPVNNSVLWISVFVKEIENEDFEKGNW